MFQLQPNNSTTTPPSSNGGGFTNQLRPQLQPNSATGGDPYTDLYNQINAHWNNPTQTQRVVDELKNQVINQFTNLVGRAPNQSEINQSISQLGSQIMGSSAGYAGFLNDPQSARNIVQNYVGDTFQKTAQDQVTQALTDQQGQANSLADLFRTQGNTAINATESSLQDYQSKLFDRLRPNLLTSLKAQDLLDTGGLNEAMAGVQGDLANNASNYIAQLHLNNEQGANQIAFGGASAPYYYKQGAITQTPNYLASQGANAANFNNNTFMSNLDFQHQMALIHQQAQDQQGLAPSFLRTLGQSTAQSFGKQFGDVSGTAAQAGMMKLLG